MKDPPPSLARPQAVPVNTAAADDLVPYACQVVPVSAAVTLNPYSEADECDLVFDYRTWPFDPRIVRAIRLAVHMGTVSSIDEVFEPSEEDTLFIGHADEGDWQPGEDNTIRLKCRDHTSLLIDPSWSGAQIDLTKPLDEILRGILDLSPSTHPIRLELRGLNAWPVLAEVRGDAGGQELSVESAKSPWDVIQRLMHEAGLIAFMELDRLVVSVAQNVSADVAAPVMAYGLNLETLTIGRDITGRGRPNIMVRSWDPTSRTTLQAVYPPPARPSESATPAKEYASIDEAIAAGPIHATGDGKPKPEKYEVYTLSHIRDQAHLEEVAKRIWQRTASQEVAVTFETREMTDVESGDLLTLRAGRPVRISISQEEREFLEVRGIDERIEYLADRGYSIEVAAAVATAYETIDPIYQVIEAKHTFTARDGYSLRAECGNYIVV